MSGRRVQPHGGEASHRSYFNSPGKSRRAAEIPAPAPYPRPMRTTSLRRAQATAVAALKVATCMTQPAEGLSVAVAL